MPAKRSSRKPRKPSPRPFQVDVNPPDHDGSAIRARAIAAAGPPALSVPPVAGTPSPVPPTGEALPVPPVAEASSLVPLVAEASSLVPPVVEAPPAPKAGPPAGKDRFPAGRTQRAGQARRYAFRRS
ncbi:hypothetical protein C5N14_28035 [Micromonospora sp. MW-13]|uniref:hypothetical protein n=1 Tax=unclassified Micromonospora TaxID=2617518 RepID=UPI000EC97B01|nr:MULTISPECIES: hypothetical protein [unclassified Micromonospora]MCX4470635.1 hypothetical protein [Micromonospora sp. NBC_01655]RGC65595.1 hypothetical protein C5N14_28035 [Micromonospora sp. MW-13]